MTTLASKIIVVLKNSISKEHTNFASTGLWHDNPITGAVFGNRIASALSACLKVAKHLPVFGQFAFLPV
jgi:hypothetical protein